jgi:hypothetical protein
LNVQCHVRMARRDSLSERWCWKSKWSNPLNKFLFGVWFYIDDRVLKGFNFVDGRGNGCYTKGGMKDDVEVAISEEVSNSECGGPKWKSRGIFGLVYGL